MSKRHPHNKSHSTNRVGTSISIDPENPGQDQNHPDFEGYSPSYEDVQRKAYLIHEEKGGNDFENWLEAERLLKEEHHMSH
jgi:hypothetical protein